MALTLEDWQSVISLGILAPSADNLQPWLFSVSEDKGSCQIALDASKVDHYCDVVNAAPYISAGAVIENMATALQNRGVQAEVVHFPSPENKLIVAQIKIRQGEPERGANYGDEILRSRCTNRKFYNGKPLSKNELDSLTRITEQEKGFSLKVVKREDSTYSDLATLVGDADQLRFEVQKLHEEFFNILRFDPKNSVAITDGLDVRTLEAGVTGPATFRLLSSWPRMKILNKCGFSRLLNKYAVRQMRSSGAAGLLCSEGSQPEDYVRGGQLMQRLWHESTRQSLSMQPMEALPIFFIHEQQNGSKDMSEKQRQQIVSMKKRFDALFDIPKNAGLILLFRIGYARPVSIRSQRRPVESFIKEAM